MINRFVIIEKDAQGKVKITLEEFKKYLEDAYNQGFEDGQKSAPIITTPSAPWPQAPSIPAPYIGDTPETIKPWFTCLTGESYDTNNKK